MFYIAFECSFNLLVLGQYCVQLLKKSTMPMKAIFCKVWPYAAHFMFYVSMGVSIDSGCQLW
jgi:hypothetical protein